MSVSIIDRADSCWRLQLSRTWAAIEEDSSFLSRGEERSQVSVLVE